MLTCGELRAILADTEQYPDDLTIWIESYNGSVSEPAMTLVRAEVFDAHAIIATEEYDEEPDYDDDFPMALEYSSPGEDARNDEVAREEAAMEREYFGE
jgi:hypothetical protein